MTRRAAASVSCGWPWRLGKLAPKAIRIKTGSVFIYVKDVVMEDVVL
jgi:hypothetical protein